MDETDSPLKRLVSQFSTEFATWLLRADVRQTRSLDTDLPGASVTADQVFHVTLTSGQGLLLHIEFQGRRSRLLTDMLALIEDEEVAMRRPHGDAHRASVQKGVDLLAGRVRRLADHLVRHKFSISTGSTSPLNSNRKIRE